MNKEQLVTSRKGESAFKKEENTLKGPEGGGLFTWESLFMCALVHMRMCKHARGSQKLTSCVSSSLTIIFSETGTLTEIQTHRLT